MSPELRAYALRQEAESHARQSVPLAELTHARVLDVALSIVADNLARALGEIENLKVRIDAESQDGGKAMPEAR